MLVLARSPDTWIDKSTTIYNALFGQANSDDDQRPYEGQIDKTKSNLIKAFKPVLGNETGKLILTKPKIGLKLNVTEKDIRIIDSTRISSRNLIAEEKIFMEKALVPELHQPSPTCCSR